MLIFLSLKDNGGPTLFSYNKNSGETRKRGALFEGDNTFGWARLSTGEGWYFSGTRPNALYINEPVGSRLFRYDVLAHSWETVFDISSQFPGKYLWQVHSSNDDRVHSFTVRDKGSYAMEGCAIYREDQRKLVYFARKGNDFDECQIDKSGKWLLIKEDLNGDGGEDNRVIDVDSNTERILMNADGAAGPLRYRLRLHGGGRQLQQSAGRGSRLGLQQGSPGRTAGFPGRGPGNAGLSTVRLDVASPSTSLTGTRNRGLP